MRPGCTVGSGNTKATHLETLTRALPKSETIGINTGEEKGRSGSIRSDS